MSSSLPSARVLASPLPRTEQDYERASDELEGALEALPGFVALFRTGRVSAPGISDLDRIVVVDEEATALSIWNSMSDQTRAIAMHSPFICDPTSFLRHRWFSHVEPLEHAGGVSIEIEEPPARDYLRRVMGVEGLIVSLLRVRKELDIGRIKVRSSLCGLYSLRHSLSLAGLEGTDAPAAWDVVDRVTELRGAWFQSSSESRAETLASIVDAAPDAIIEALAGVPSSGGERLTRGMRLARPWSNVELVSRDGQAATAPGRVSGRALRWAGRRRRSGELAWRTRRLRLGIPPAAMSLIGAPTEELAGLRRERDSIVRRYNTFVDGCGSEWSRLGFATPFLPT